MSWEIPQWLRALAALPEDLGFFSSTHDSSKPLQFQGSCVLIWPQQAPGIHVVHRKPRRQHVHSNRKIKIVCMCVWESVSLGLCMWVQCLRRPEMASDPLELKLLAVVSLLIWEWVTKISSNFPVYLLWILCRNESLFPPQVYRAPDDCLIYLWYCVSYCSLFVRFFS